MTISRLFLAPLYFAAYFFPDWLGHSTALFTWIVLAIYILIELSDVLDGYIARKYNCVTDLGKVMDPFADVFSRLTYFVCFTVSGIMPAWVFLIILYRELGVTFLRMVMIKRGTAMAASIYGKFKAVL
ncbi:MAG: CDP-alcohol phosphatidyltransferase family protein, partial [Spirochaetales bacterium]|nr:CDP-alcohol phosphatidyltransferase family protein [Spirochaetales bacterium]